MSRMGSGAVAALAVVGILCAASPASAFVSVACKAKNSAGKSFVHTADGIFEWDSKLSATTFAMAKCQDGSKKPDSCKIVECHITNP